MKLLSQLEANNIICNARSTMQMFPDWRLGQTIWNNLRLSTEQSHKEIANSFHGTDKDFFYWRDEKKVLECFYTHYVDYDKQEVNQLAENIEPESIDPGYFWEEMDAVEKSK